MKTELLHSYSSNSLANLSRVYSSTTDLRRIGESEKNGEINPTFETDEDGLRSFSTHSSGESSGGSGDKDQNQDKLTARDICHSIFKRKLLYKRLPVLQWSQEYNTTKLVADIIAGLTVGLTILPQGLAYAKIAGIPPQYGLYSGFVGCFIYILFGGSKIITVGPTAIMALITLSYVQGKPATYAVFLSFFSGLVTFFMGVFQMGFIVNFISTPVISAFTSAAALVICSTQIKPLLGLSYKADGFREIVFRSFLHLSEIKYTDALLSLACVIVLLFMQNLQSIFRCFTTNSPKIDRALWFIATSRSVIVILVCTMIFSCIDNDLFPVKVVGDIVPGLPSIDFPPFSASQNISGEVEEISFIRLLNEDLSALITIPLLAIIEHFTIAKKFAGTSMLDPSQEMISIGIINILGCFFSSMPVTGSFSRSVVNAASGAVSPLGGIITGTLVILSLQFLTPYFYYIPDASLAAVIVCAVIFTVDFSVVVDMYKSKKMDLIPWGFTFFLSLLLDLTAGILSGIVISIIFLLYYAARPAVQVKRAETAIGNEFVIVGLDRSLIFPNTEYIRYMITKSRKLWAKGYLPVVIDCSHIQYADFSAAQGIRDLFITFNEKNHPLILWKAKPSIIRILRGLMDSCNVPFQYCMTDDDLEKAIDGDCEDKPIEFTVSSIPSTKM